MSNKSHDSTDWSCQVDQQFWFDRFKSADGVGLRFHQFQEFLKETLYRYFEKFPSPKQISENGHNNEQQGAKECKFTHQQEMQLFKIFDAKNDHLVDRDEFGHLCQKWLDKIYRPSCAFVIVDVQNDFIDGSLALINGPAGQDGAEVVPVINDLIDGCNFQAIVYTQDWHPANHIGFHANLHLRKYTLKRETPSAADGNLLAKDHDTGHDHQQQEKENSTGADDEINNNNSCKFKLKKLAAKAQVFDTVLFDDGQVEQKLWPTHCVQNSWGAQLHPKLKIVPDAIRIYKGTLAHVDAYSAFWDNMRLNETGLRRELLSRKINDLFFCGLAFDYCVAASAIDSAKAGFITFVIEDACRGIDEQEMEHRRKELIANGVLIVNSWSVKSYLARDPSAINEDKANENLDQNMIRSICFKRALLC